jgi:hypothetical protein
VSKFGNILAKGLKVGAHVIVGSVGAGLGMVALHWAPPATWPPIAIAAWYGAGASIVGGASAAITRWAQFDPTKLGK